MAKKTSLIGMLFLTLTPSLAFAEIRGLYGTNCLEGKGVSAVKDMLLREQTLETVQTLYSDSACETPAYDFSFRGPYDLDQDSGFLNYSYSSIKLQALSLDVVERFNASALCGISDWAIGVAREVSGLNCGGQLIPFKNSRAFDLIKANEDESVQLGLIDDIEDGLSLETRPSALENLIYYPK